MTFLLLNQTFYPDVASTAQHLADLARRLVERGHQVTVLTSRRAYDLPEKLFSKQETWRGVRIYRVGSTGFGKGAKWRRAADFASFLVAATARLALLPRHDVVMALTSPPLISFLGAWVARLRRSAFVYWVMDFNPDEAIAAGWLRADSLATRLLDRMSRFSLRCASKIVALDRFMGERIVAKGIAPEKVRVIPPWSHDDEARFDPDGRERFRREHGLEGKFVVMYSGNHSPCHPLDTLLGAARRLASDSSIVFCFVGGGSEWRKIRKAVEEAIEGQANIQHPKAGTTNHGPRTTDGAERSALSNVLCLPYQPLEQLAGSLSAADLHVVVMGGAFVGLVHPCKVYNILNVGAPILYIGPGLSHISELLDSLGNEYPVASVAHGEGDGVIEQIKRFQHEPSLARRQTAAGIQSPFSKEVHLPKLIAELENFKDAFTPSIHCDPKR